MKLTDDQQTIYENVIKDIQKVRQGDIFGEHSWISIKGSAGTGKTTLTKSIVQKLLQDNFRIIVVSPTHQAVKVIKNIIDINDERLQFGSLHSFLGLQPGEIDNITGERKFIKTDYNYRSQIARDHFDVCILDESSMVSTELFSFVKEEMYKNNRIKSFVFLGDEYQLLPIEQKSGIPHSIYGNKMINHYNLTKLIRNPDMEVTDFVNTIRQMVQDKKTKQDLYKFLEEEYNKEHNKIKFYKNKQDFVKAYISEDRLGSYDDVIATFTNENVDTYNFNLRAYYTKDKNGNVPEIHNKDLFVVQSTVNAASGNSKFQNSEILELSSYKVLTKKFMKKSFKYFKCIVTDGRKFNLLKKESEQEFFDLQNKLKSTAIYTRNPDDWKKYYSSLKVFLDVRPHYANTTHRLQGSTYRDIYVDLNNLDYVDDNDLLRLFYVSTTRSKRNVHILL